jgi:hypothetical protein
MLILRRIFYNGSVRDGSGDVTFTLPWFDYYGPMYLDCNQQVQTIQAGAGTYLSWATWW